MSFTEPLTVAPPAVGLRELRLSRGVSQEQLARLADASVSMVALLDRGYMPRRRSPVAERVIETLRALPSLEGGAAT